MPRKPRKKSSNGVYHIMLRGINKQTIFEDDGDRMKLLQTLKKYKDVSRVEVYCYCLMDNHIHLLVRENDETVSKFIQRVSASYVYWYNAKYERCGHLFQGRFRSGIVETIPSFLRVLRYIHQNPVKAGIEKNVLDCKWTSLNEYFCQPGFVDVDLALRLFSPDRKTAIKLFMDYMQIPNKDCFLDEDSKVKMLDSEVKSYLADSAGIKSSGLQQLEKEQRDKVILELKQLNGVTIRQLSRVTGISKSVIERIR